MSHKVYLHDGTGVLLDVPGHGIMFAMGTTVPSDGATGYGKGCIFVDTDAAAGSILFCNEGTTASADFDAVSVA